MDPTELFAQLDLQGSQPNKRYNEELQWWHEKVPDMYWARYLTALRLGLTANGLPNFTLDEESRPRVEAMLLKLNEFPTIREVSLQVLRELHSCGLKLEHNWPIFDGLVWQLQARVTAEGTLLDL